MCGIYGSTKYYDDIVLIKKIESMKHRGPDFQDFKRINGNLTFGHVRLSIIDLDTRSNQPLRYDHLTITFNGEIYNYTILKKDLTNKGYKFTTTSDTEVLCALYLDKGAEMVKHLKGMFAFVIHDGIKNILFGARDRMGQKPFYYCLKDGDFEFSSQLTPIRTSNKLEVDREAIKQYLEWGYVPEPNAIYMDTYKLKASHCFTYDLKTKALKTDEYWSLNDQMEIPKNYKDCVSSLDNLLDESVKLRLMSDVPLGVFLSGGVDSSLIASYAQKNTTKKIKTFSVGFEESDFDETIYAEKVAKFLETDHTRIVLSSDEAINFIDDFNDYYDEPFYDTSAFGQMLLSRETAKYVTVALTGDGGDELFLGYNRYKKILTKEHIYKIPSTIRNLMSNIYKLKKDKRNELISKALKLNNIEDYYLCSMKHVDRSWLNFSPLDEASYIGLLYSNKNLLERISDFEIKTYMNGDIHTKVDRGTMKYSLEARSPLMDYKIVEFSRAIPTDYKYDNGKGKKILKDVLYKHVPQELFDRKKTGFSVPIGEWFKNDLKEYVYHTITSDNLSLVPEINAHEFYKILKEHMDGKWNHTPKIWSVLILLRWLIREDLLDAI